jgi:hypothetical protein
MHCYDPDKLWLDGVQTYRQRYEATMARRAAIASVVPLKAVWAHEWRDGKQTCADLRAVCESINMDEHTGIVARDALYGTYPHTYISTLHECRFFQVAA